MDFSDVVFTGNAPGMKLSRKLTEYARDNDIHESDDTDIVCHCDFCQVFIPMAEKMEKFIAKTEARRALVEDVTAYQRGGGAPELSVRLPEQAEEAQDGTRTETY